METATAPDLKPIVTLEFDELPPSLNVWQGQHWTSKKKTKKAWEDRIALKADMAGYTGLNLPDPGKRRVVVGKFFSPKQRDASNVLGPFNKCITDVLQEKVQRKNPKTKKMESVYGTLPLIRGDGPDEVLEVVSWKKASKRRLVLEVWEEEDWDKYQESIAQAGHELTIPLDSDKRLPKCRREPGLFDSEDRPQVLDVVWLKEDEAPDDFEQSCVVVARHESEDLVEIALVPFNKNEWTCDELPPLALRFDIDSIIQGDDVDGPQPWEGLDAEKREFCRKVWDSWTASGRKIRALKLTPEYLEREDKAAEEADEAKERHELCKDRSKKAKADLEAAQAKLQRLVLSRRQPTEWPWKED